MEFCYAVRHRDSAWRTGVVRVVDGVESIALDFVRNLVTARQLAQHMNLRRDGDPILPKPGAFQSRSWSTPEGLNVTRSILECAC